MNVIKSIPIKLPFHDLFISFGNGNLKLEYPQTSYPPPINPIMRKSGDFLHRLPKMRELTLRSVPSIASSTELLSSQFTLTTHSSLNTSISHLPEANLKEQSNIIKHLQLQISNLQTYISQQTSEASSLPHSPRFSLPSSISPKPRYFPILEEDKLTYREELNSPTIQ
jgi:hypothetical protein